MKAITFGIIKEGKTPPDMRVPLTPKQCVEFGAQFPDAKVIVQNSDVRVFKDAQYADLGTSVQPEVSEADVLMGVKEVPIDMLVPNKTYLFFSHTIKEQPYNAKLLRACLEKNITLIDYETLTNKSGARLVGFGYYAGVVGTYNGIKAYGKRTGSFDLPEVLSLSSMDDMAQQLQSISLPNLKMVVTGSGRVASGILDVMEMMNIIKVTPNDFISKTYNQPAYTQLGVLDYNKRRDGEVRNNQDFYNNSSDYTSDFMRFAKVADVYFAGHYYAEGAPYLFTRADAKNPDFNLKVVADISCDIDGPVASTIRPSTIENPIYGYHANTESEVAFNHPEAITVMAVDNLPCEFPTVASEGFGRELMKHIIPQFFNNDEGDILQRATITENGKLTSRYSYLEAYSNA